MIADPRLFFLFLASPFELCSMPLIPHQLGRKFGAAYLPALLPKPPQDFVAPSFLLSLCSDQRFNARHHIRYLACIFSFHSFPFSYRANLAQHIFPRCRRNRLKISCHSFSFYLSAHLACIFSFHSFHSVIAQIWCSISAHIAAENLVALPRL